MLKLLVVLKGGVGINIDLTENQVKKCKIDYSQKCIKEMIQLSGVTLPPLKEVQGDLNNIDLSKIKSKEN